MTKEEIFLAVGEFLFKIFHSMLFLGVSAGAFFWIGIKMGYFPGSLVHPRLDFLVSFAIFTLSVLSHGFDSNEE